MIRDYKEKDAEDVMTLWLEAQNIAHPFLEEDFVSKVKIMMKEQFIPNSKTWVYEQDKHVIGFIAMMNNEIGGLFVNPTEQSKGIGTQLLKFASQFHEELEVEVFDENKIGKPFYIKQGFIEISNYTHEETNQKVIRMQLK